VKGLIRGGGSKVVATGSRWIGQGIGSIESALEDMLNEAQDEVQVAAFNITEGASQFLKILEDCLARGVQVTLVVNRLHQQPKQIQQALASLRSKYAHFTEVDFNPENKGENLHAKIVVVDRSLALVGSPNLTWSGLVLNYELGVVVSGKVANNVGHLLDSLVRDKSSHLQ
jgi:cardiolipin synthase